MSKDRSIPGGTATSTGGFQAGRGASANRLPSAPRERKPALAALAVLLILAGALATMTLVTRSGNRISVVRMKNTVVAGQTITANDIEEWQVAADGDIDYVLYDQRGKLGVTYNTLAQGSLLTGRMLGSPTNTSVPKGEVVVGATVKHYPFKWLSVNDKVNVYTSASSGGSSGNSSTNSTPAPGSSLIGTAQIVYLVGSTDSVTITLAAAPDVADKIVAAGDTLTITKTIG